MSVSNSMDIFKFGYIRTSIRKHIRWNHKQFKPRFSIKNLVNGVDLKN